MTSPDFQTFVDTLLPGHANWLATSGKAVFAFPGDAFLDHYVGDTFHPDGLLFQFELWRAEHGYVGLRPWNGSEALGRKSTPEIPSPGRVAPWLSVGAGPSLAHAALADGTTVFELQTQFGSTNKLGEAIRDQWNVILGFVSSSFAMGSLELAPGGLPEYAIYSLRFWGFLKWAGVLRDKLQGVLASTPAIYDDDGVPLTDIEFMDEFNRLHRSWHQDASNKEGLLECAQSTEDVLQNPFAPHDSPWAQLCYRDVGPEVVVKGEFLHFHRDVVRTYNAWRQRGGMPPVGLWRKPDLHFHCELPLQGKVPCEDEANEILLDLGKYAVGSPAERAAIASVVRHFYQVDDLSNYIESAMHSTGHILDLGPVDTNTYSPRFFSWHRFVDYCWEIREPRLDEFQLVDGQGSSIDPVLTVIRPYGNPDIPPPAKAQGGASQKKVADIIVPANALSSTQPGTLSLTIGYTVRPETYGRDIKLSIVARVYANSMDLDGFAVSELSPIPIALTVPYAQQGKHATAELKFPAAAFATTETAGVVNFANARIRVTAHLLPVGPITGSIATGVDQIGHYERFDVVLVRDTAAPTADVALSQSAFSVDEIVAGAGQGSHYKVPSALTIIVQDPRLPPVAFETRSVFADPGRAAVSGVFVEKGLAPAPKAILDGTDTVATWVTAAFVDAQKQNPPLPDHRSQPVRFRYDLVFDVPTLKALLKSHGDAVTFRLCFSVRDRANNATHDVCSAPIQVSYDHVPALDASKWNEMVEILFGVTGGGGGLVVTPGGHPVPIDPGGPVSLRSSVEHDALVAAVIDRLATLIDDPASRQALRRVAGDIMSKRAIASGSRSERAAPR